MAQLPQFQGTDRPTQMMQNTWASILNPLLANPLSDGLLLKDVPLVSGTTIVNHRLARKLQGWIIVGINAAATIYDNQAANSTKDLTLSLTSNAACTVTLFVF